jgi:UDP-N-acetylmuramoyl-L-alanyl-D-glutamate--2,6-diaminopimelate ligase
MRFSELLAQSELDVQDARGDVEIDAVWSDSRRCGPGSCFVAVRGTQKDGHDYIAQAIQSGASAVVCESDANVPEDIPCAVVADSHPAVGCCAQALHGWPARLLTCVAVTGTNGKTTVAHLTRALLAGAGYNTGLIGTITYESGQRITNARMTTPDPEALAELMAEMVDAGCSHVVMEASSHALDQDRMAGIDVDAAIYTNLSGDHLDYHGTMEEYLAAKSKLFASLGASASAAINRDDAYAEQIAAVTDAKICWYGLSGAADMYARIGDISAEKTCFELIYHDEVVPVESRLIGRHNIYNSLAAACAAHRLGVSLEQIAATLKTIEYIPGRLQRVPCQGDFDVFVDYAHTDDALGNVLGALRPLTRGRLILVFGCGGDRDRTKRPRMAAVAQGSADTIIVTSDNPRSEPPGEIIDEILEGFDPDVRSRVEIEPDRRRAIRLAIGRAEPGDVVLLAGKGHETYQIVRGVKSHFDDAEVAAACLAERQGS